jgi:hypothetical protein
MLTYSDVQNLLDAAVGSDPVHGHRAFWRGITRDAFVAKIVFGYPLISLNDAAGSNLTKSLRGEAPFGDDMGTPDATMPRMPAWRTEMADEDIDRIAEWIDGGCPE